MDKECKVIREEERWTGDRSRGAVGISDCSSSTLEVRIRRPFRLQTRHGWLQHNAYVTILGEANNKWTWVGDRQR
jgi:hypothetical protein